MKYTVSSFLLVVLGFGLLGCDMEELEEARTALEEMGESISEMNEQRENAENGSGGAEPVDFRSLRDLLPERAVGLERIDVEGERQGMMGMSVSRAQASYAADGPRHLNISMMDIGGVAGFQLLGYGWVQAEVDRETSSGYERTGTFQGYRSREEYNSDSQRGRLQVLVGERFIVEAEGSDISMDDLKDAVNQISLQQLEALGEQS